MRKLSLLIVLAGGIVISSCAYRTCPTYSKQQKQDPPTEKHIKETVQLPS